MAVSLFMHNSEPDVIRLVSCPTIAFMQFAAPGSRQGRQPPPYLGRYRASPARKG